MTAGETGMDMLISTILPFRTVVVEGSTHFLAEVFKTVPGGREMEVAYFEPRTGRWALMREDTATQKLSKLCSKVIEEACGDDWVGDIPVWARKGGAMQASAKSSLRDLFDQDFYTELDGECYRQWLMFKDGTAFHRDTHETVRGDRSMKISKAMGIDFPAKQFEARYTSTRYLGCRYSYRDKNRDIR